MGNKGHEGLQKRVEGLGGRYSANLTKHATHLIAARINNSAKYLSAKKLQIPVLSVAFVEDCWARAHLGGVDFAQMEKQYTLPVLFGCRISVSGISPEERSTIARMVQAYGGTYCPDLSATCTHLLLQASETTSVRSSPKISFALQWNVPIINLDWLHQSISKNICLDDGPFRLESQLQLSGQPDGPTQSFMYQDLTVEEIAKAACSLPPYLDGCHFYVGERNVPAERLSLLKRLVLAAGGTRHSDLYDRTMITHFVVHNQTIGPHELKLLNEFGTDHLPFVVHDQWLFACFFAKTRLPLDAYQIDPSKFQGNQPDALLTNTTTPSGTSWSLKLPLNLPPPPLPLSLPPLHSHSLALAPPSIAPSTLPATTPPMHDSLPVFSGLCFRVQLDKHEAIKAAQMTELIERHGGTILAGDNTINACDYIVTPLIILKEATLPQGQPCNELWLEQCITQRRILDLENQSVYRPFTAEVIDPNAFVHLRVSITGYAGMERDYYGRLCQAMGAAYTENLTRKNTHLICKIPTSGPKFDFARMQGIACVTADWLLYSIRAGMPANLEEFAAETSKDESPLKEVVERTAVATPTESLISAVQDPQRRPPAGQIAMETPLRRQLSKRLREAAETVTGTGLTQLSPGSEKLDHLISTKREPSKDISSILKGFIFAISQRLWHRREEIHDLVTEMGGIFVWSYDTSCTHYIHQGNLEEETFREFRTVRQHGKWIVSPWWLTRSREAGIKLPESDFGHTYNPDAVIIPISTALEETEEIPVVAICAERKKPKPIVKYDLSISTLRSNPPPQSPLFALSGLTAEQRRLYPATLQNLGAKVLSASPNWQAGSTHLIIGTLSKSEKFLAACAAGCWVLRPEYVEACERENRLVEEARFEWQASWSDEDKGLADAPRYWRERLFSSALAMGDENRGAFWGWKVLLVADQKRLAGLRGILLAGRAEVLLLSDILEGRDSHQATALTHIFVSSTQMRSKIPEKIFEKANAKLIHNIDYIAEFLLCPNKI